MAFLEGKTQTEKKQMAAAAVLGLVALITLYFAFGRSLFGSSTTTATAKSSPTPKPSVPASATRTDVSLPSDSEQIFSYQTTAVVYPGSIYAPDPGRNIFAFYEPEPPCKGDQCPPSPIPSPTPVKSPTPLPPPPVVLAAFSPQSVYAGAKAFRLEVTGDKFTPETNIYFDQNQIPTTFINTQKMVADIPANMIANEGTKQIIVQNADGKLYSNQMLMSVQAPPKPTLLYIGMIGHKGYNNDKAILADNEKAPPFSARLNDVVAGRFRLVEISPAEVTFEDTGLGFRHRIPISKGILIGSMPPGRGTGAEPGQPTYPPGFIPQNIPGIPNNIQQFSPEEQKKMEVQRQMQKEDVDDEGDG